MALTLDFQGDLVMTHVTSAVASSDLVAAMEQILASPSFVRGLPFLVLVPDLAFLPSQEESQASAGIIGEFQDRGLGPVAVVAPLPLQFGIGRMIDAYAESVGAVHRVFRDEAEARAWLAEIRDSAAG